MGGGVGMARRGLGERVRRRHTVDLPSAGRMGLEGNRGIWLAAAEAGHDGSMGVTYRGGTGVISLGNRMAMDGSSGGID